MVMGNAPEDFMVFFDTSHVRPNPKHSDCEGCTLICGSTRDRFSYLVAYKYLLFSMLVRPAQGRMSWLEGETNLI